MPKLPPFLFRRRAHRQAAARRAALAADVAVELPCRARRTTARGWGEWVDGRLRLPGPDGGPADFVADHPLEASLVTRRGEAPVLLETPLEVAVRDARYKAEAFHGTGTRIISATTPRRTVEIALPAPEVEATARRLTSLSG